MFILNPRSGLIWKKKKIPCSKTYCSDYKNLLFTVQNHCSSSPSSNRTPLPTTPITANIDSGLQQQRQRFSQCRPLQRQRPSTVPSSPPTISDRQSSRTDRWQPPSSTDRGGPRLQQPNQNHKPPPSVPAIAIHLHQPRLLSTATKIYNSSHSSQINSPSANRLSQQQINSTQRLAMADQHLNPFTYIGLRGLICWLISKSRFVWRRQPDEGN